MERANETHDGDPEARRTPSPGLVLCAWLTSFLGVSATLQNVMPSYFDADTAYHLAVARLTREHGVLHAFPWTPFSWLAEHYADKELLFHWLLVPLAELDPILAGRIAGTLLGAALLATLYGLLRCERVPQAGLWALLSLASSSAFIHRFALVRAHMLSIPLALVVVWSATRRRWLVLGFVCAIYPLCYTAWHLPLVLIAIVEGVRFAAHREIAWRSALVAVPAIALGIGLHPNFPQNLELFWIQNVTVLFGTAWADRAGFDLGGEFNAFSFPGMVRYVLWPAAFVVAALALGWRARRADPLPMVAATVALAFLAITLRTQRFIEYLAPFAVFALALALARSTRAPASRGAGGLWLRRWPRATAPVLLVAGSLWIALFARHPLDLLRGRDVAFPPRVAAALREIVPEGAQVVTCDWRVTGEMLLALPDRRFMVALDPVFFAMHDEEAYRLWFETMHAPPADAASVLRDAFDARYVICDRRARWQPLAASLAADPAARLRGVYGLWAVYELDGGAPLAALPPLR